MNNKIYNIGWNDIMNDKKLGCGGLIFIIINYICLFDYLFISS